MALEVGSVFARLGAKLDDAGFDRYERRLDQARREGHRGATAHLTADHDSRGFDRYNRNLKEAEASSSRATEAAKGHGSALGGLGKAAAYAAGPAAIYGLTMGIKGAFNAYKESERVAKQTNAVLQSTGGAAGVSAKQVGDLANAISRKTGIDDEAIQSGENLLLTFTNVKNEAGKGNDIFNQTTSIMTDMSAALGQDTKSSAIQLGKALNDPVKGVTALQRVGVSFTKSQKEQIKGLVDHGKTLDAQKLILRELNKEFGGSAAKTATASKRLGVTFGNLAEGIGRAVSPALEKVAKGLDKFVNGLLKGQGAGGKFLSVVKGAFNAVAGVVRSVAGFVDNALHRNAGTIHSLGATLGRVAGDVKRLLSGIAGAFRGTFGHGSSTGRDLQNIISVVLKVASTVAKVAEAIVRRALPGIITAFRGLAQIIKGVVEVITGILTLRFGKAWDGIKDIFGGAIKAIGGLLRAGTAPLREAASRIAQAIGHVIKSGLDDVVGFFRALPGRAVAALKGLPGALGGLGREAIKALGKGLSGAASIAGDLAGAIGGAIKGAINGLIGKLNDAIPNSLGKGPLKINLPDDPIPTLRAGGKPGNVGPGHGGARAFIAGEGSADEWVISQEGDRRSNIAWAREALETLTGRPVELHKAGRRPKRKSHALKPVLDPSGMKRRVGAGEGGIKNFERDIARMERKYGLDERAYGADDVDFVIENDDGTSSLDTGAIDNRVGDLRSLHAERKSILDKYRDYKARVESLIKTYTAAVARLNRAIKAARSSKRKKERQGYLSLRQGYTTRIDELHDVARDLDLDVNEQGQDLGDLEREAAGLAPDKRGALLPAAPAADTGTDAGSTDAGSSSSSSSTTSAGTDAGGTTTTAPPSPEEVAAAAIAQVTAFNSARADLFGNYGGNFAAAGGPGAFAGEPGGGAGSRYFGGAGDYGGEGGAGAPSVTQVITFAGPQPADPHTFTQASLHELKAAL